MEEDRLARPRNGGSGTVEGEGESDDGSDAPHTRLDPSLDLQTDRTVSREFRQSLSSSDPSDGPPHTVRSVVRPVCLQSELTTDRYVYGGPYRIMF